MSKTNSPRPLPPSLYAATARPAPPAEPLAGDRRTSVAIVGGGFTGLSTALALAERGVDCVVLEANEIGWGASGRNGGQVNAGLKYNPSAIVKKFGEDLGNRMIRLAWGSPGNLFDMIERYDIQCEASQNGSLRVAFSPTFAKTIDAAFEDEQTFGRPVRAMGADACQAYTGAEGRYVRGMLDPTGGSVNPLGLARGLADQALRAGSTIHPRTRVNSVRRNGAQWILRTDCGDVIADKVVLATNGYTDGIWQGLRQSLISAYTGIVATVPLPDSVAAAIIPQRGIVYEVGSLTTYYRKDSFNRLLMGGVDRQREQGGTTEFRSLRKYAEKLWPQLRGVTWEYGWNGLACLTPDYLPHVHEPVEGVIACVGYNGRGVALASAMGDQLARRLTGAPASEFDMPITNIKEMPFHMFARTAVALRIEYGRIRDYIGL